MGIEIKTVGVIGAGQMGNGIAHVCSLAGLNVRLNDLSRGPHQCGPCHDQRQHGPPGLQGRHHRRRAQAALAADQAGADLRRSRRLRHRHRGRDRERGGQAQDLPGPVPVAAPGRDGRHQHVLDLDHPPCRLDRPARALHRHPLHEPGAGDAARRADPRHRHRGPDLRIRQGIHRQARQDRRRCRRISRPSSSTASCCR